MPLDEQHAVIERMRDALDPPEGVTAHVAGLPVLAAEANAALASPWRRLGTLLAGYEKDCSDNAWRHDGTGNAVGTYLRFLATLGYTLSDVEEYAVSDQTA